jgi:hypothetical protein
MFVEIILSVSAFKIVFESTLIEISPSGFRGEDDGRTDRRQVMTIVHLTTGICFIQKIYAPSSLDRSCVAMPS